MEAGAANEKNSYFAQNFEKDLGPRWTHLWQRGWRIIAFANPRALVMSVRHAARSGMHIAAQSGQGRWIAQHSRAGFRALSGDCAMEAIGGVEQVRLVVTREAR
jgi:hypothetical protein